MQGLVVEVRAVRRAVLEWQLLRLVHADVHHQPGPDGAPRGGACGVRDARIPPFPAPQLSLRRDARVPGLAPVEEAVVLEDVAKEVVLRAALLPAP